MELQKVRGREKVSAPDLCFPGIFRADRSAKCITGHDNVEQIRRVLGMFALPKDCPDCRQFKSILQFKPLCFLTLSRFDKLEQFSSWLSFMGEFPYTQ